MNIPIVITAFGTTSRALSTYSFLDTLIRNRFPEHEVLWSFSSRAITAERKGTNALGHPAPEFVLQQLSEQGHKYAILQSAHLWPGHEFHKLVKIGHRCPLTVSLGMPLLSSPLDYEKLCPCLDNIAHAHKNRALIIAGHGTSHPAWSGYFALDHFLRKRFGNHIFMALLKGYPTPAEMIQQVKDAGFDSACLLPFMLVAGRHFERELTGSGPDSWQSQLSRAGISLQAIDHGLGMMEGVAEIFCDHISEALAHAHLSDSR
ncbi:MAG: sirohydrochlorin cobaltochelatase [Proteobacteria bacterium]|nr:sirohydrochlorin cobaltochelatase [Pseudomonadota bacterium]MBU1060049.1 sirohydrochlorin cobaltochelatase [Pseudomonadota bacterium]